MKLGGAPLSKRAIALLAALSVVVIVLAYIVIAIRLAPRSVTNVTVHGPLTVVQPVLNKTLVLQYNATQLAAYALLSYQIANATSGNLTMDVYTKAPFQRIYLVNVSGNCFSCYSENQLRDSLVADLQSYDLARNFSSFSYVPLQSLQFAAPNSIVIIPSGIIPFALVNNTLQGSLYALLNKGDTVLYIGRNLTRSQNAGLIIINPQSVVSQLTSYNIKFFGIDRDRQRSMTAASVANGLYFAQPTYILSGNRTYGNATYMFTGNGTLIAFSNYQMTGWQNASDVASDIAKAIDARLWAIHVGHGSAPFNATSSGSAGVWAVITNSTVNASSTYSLVTFQASNPAASVTLQSSYRNSYAPFGSVGVNSTVAESQVVPITVSIQNPNRVLIHVEVFDRNLTDVDSIPIGFISNTFRAQKNHAFQVPSGTYLLGLYDQYKTYYAGAVFTIAPANITPTSADFKGYVFGFSATSANIPLRNASYAISVNQAYNKTGTITNGTILYALPQGAVLSYGTEQFEIKIFGQTFLVNETHSAPIFEIPPIYIEFGIAGIVILLLNLILRPPQLDEYYIDVPDFLPTKKEKVKLNTGTVVSVFDKVNYYHRWRYMPLTSDELRQGVGNNVRINNMPIMITTHNANVLLSELLQEDEVVESSGYYAPKAWLQTSRHSLEYLVVFRKLRDYCVANALLFTDIDASDKADMIMTKETKQINVFIYTKDAKMRSLELDPDARNVIAFVSEERRKEFEDELYSAYGEEAMMLKLGIEYNYVKLVDCDDLKELTF